MPTPRRTALLAAVLAIATLAGCDGSTTPSASPSTPAPSATPSGSSGPTGSPAPATPGPSEDLAALYGAINDQVQAIRGLEEREPVEPQIVSREELGSILEAQVREETPPEVLGAYERLYKAMGLMPDEQSLTEVFVDLFESQVAGLYVPSDKSLYVVSREGGVGPVEQVYYSHEYEHALQDQHFDLAALQPADLVDQTDRQLAVQALIEGDAYVLMSYWLRENLSPAELLDVLSSSNDQEAIDALEDIPPIVSNQILFPATNGLVWALNLQSEGGWEAIDAAFADPPDSTEQVLHPDKWEAREQPLQVELPDNLAARMGDGWELTLEDTLGEHQIAVWLTDSVPTGGFPPAPPAEAVGWGGDRLAFLEGPDGAYAVAIATEWDTADDAAEFLDAIVEHRTDWDAGSVVAPSGTSEVWVLIGSSDDVVVQLESALGLAGV